MITKPPAPCFLYVVSGKGRTKVGTCADYQKRSKKLGHYFLGPKAPTMLIQHENVRAIESMVKDDLYPFARPGSFECFDLPVEDVVAAVNKVIADYASGRRPLTYYQKTRLKKRTPRLRQRP